MPRRRIDILRSLRNVFGPLAVPAVIVLLAMCTTSCGNDSGENRVSVGISMPSKAQTRWVSEGESMAKAFTASGYTAHLKFANEDAGLQAEQVQAMVDQGDKVLIISAVDSFELGEVLRIASSRGVKVIAYDRLLMGTSYVDYYASFDNHKVGQLQGNYIINKLGLREGAGPSNVELFAGDPGDNNAAIFYKGSMDVLMKWIKNGKIVVKSDNIRTSQVTTLHWSGEDAEATMATRLREHYGSADVDAVLSPYDGMSRGVIKALTDDGYGSGDKEMPLVTGQDAEVDSIKEIIAGKQSMTVFKDTRKLATVAVEMAEAIIKGGKPVVNDSEQYDNGNKVVPARLLEPVVVDKSNYRKLLIDSGYISDSQLR
ncbi:substrate-binding domain-containing protein [Actinacidiphila glaucinigra]|uniref:substrate-binding domain-containing protein n=1 Tax=Actinacidiphila glaucinigra TaxID=235986 RepID=UPI0035D99013